jgi:hypothetical protein
MRKMIYCGKEKEAKVAIFIFDFCLNTKLSVALRNFHILLFNNNQTALPSGNCERVWAFVVLN